MEQQSKSYYLISLDQIKQIVETTISELQQSKPEAQKNKTEELLTLKKW